MNTQDVQKLAELARLSLTENEIAMYQKDFEGILGYIDTLQSVELSNKSTSLRAANTNYLRNDDSPNESGTYTQELLDEAPQTEDNFIKVQKIL